SANRPLPPTARAGRPPGALVMERLSTGICHCSRNEDRSYATSRAVPATEQNKKSLSSPIDSTLRRTANIDTPTHGSRHPVEQERNAVISAVGERHKHRAACGISVDRHRASVGGGPSFRRPRRGLWRRSSRDWE